MPYAKTKDGSLVNEVTLGDGYPLSNDLQPLKIGGEASILGISSPLPDGSDSGLFRVDGDLDITGTLKTKLSHDLIYDFDDEVNTLAQAKIDALIDSAPAALDTLNELAAALNDDASFSTTVTNSIATKVGLTGDETVAGVKTFSSSLDLTGISSDPADGDKVRIGRTDAYTSEILQINSNDGYLRLGPYNANYCHFVTDRPMFYFNQDISVDTGLISSFNEDLIIRRVFNDTSYNQITLGDDSFELKLDNTARVSVDGDGNVGIGVTDPDSRLEVVGAGNDNSTHALYVKNSDNTNLFYVRDDGVVSVLGGYFFAQHSNGAYFTGSIKARGGITDDGGDLGLGSGGNVDHMTISSGNVGIGLTAPTTTLDVEGTVSYKHTAFTTAGPTDNVDVSDTTVLECDTSGGHLTIGGFSGGVQGQILYVVKTTTDLNRVILENNEGGGSQDIFLSSGADLSISLPSGIALYCNGSDWFALDK